LIAITDHRGRTIFKFTKEDPDLPDAGWALEEKGAAGRKTFAPKWIDAGNFKPPPSVHRAPSRLRHIHDGHWLLDVRDEHQRHSASSPDSEVPWEELGPVLDILWATGITRLTAAHLRFCIDSNC
jgi:hypothetical protein